MLGVYVFGLFCIFFFFFQAEDGIRDLYVTGVQTCALPICAAARETDAQQDGLDVADAAPLYARRARIERGQRHGRAARSEEHTSELQSRRDLVCRLLLEKKKKKKNKTKYHQNKDI